MWQIMNDIARAFFILMSLFCGTVNGTAHAQQARLLAEVKALSEEKEGLFADVYVVDRSGHQKWLGETDANGTAIFSPAVPCEHNPRIVVRPAATLRYQQSGIKTCETKLLFILKRWKIIPDQSGMMHEGDPIHNLMLWAEALDEKEEFGRLSLVYSELGARLARLDWAMADQARQQAYLFAGKELNVDQALTFDPLQKTFVMSYPLKRGLENFQGEKDLNVTGQLDSDTLQAMAGSPYWPFLYAPYRKGPLYEGGPDPRWGEVDPEVVVQIVANIEAHVKVAIKNNDSALVALLYTEMAQRLFSIGEMGRAKYAEKLSYEFAAKVLGVSQGTEHDPVQDKWVLGKALKQAIRRYQTSHDLPSSGRLDYRTLRSLSGTDIGPYLVGPPEEKSER